jgi:transposase InsO family protein
VRDFVDWPDANNQAASRAVLSWRLSNTMDVSYCIAALEEALAKYGAPKIFNAEGLAVHLDSLHRSACRGRHRHFHGRTRALNGRRLHRAAVALAQA